MVSTLLTGLISFWNLTANNTDQGGGNVGTDTAISYTTPVLGRANLDGATSKIVLTTAIAMPADLTIVALIKMAAGFGNSIVFGDSDVSAASWYIFRVSSDGRLFFGWAKSGVGNAQYATTDVVIGDTNDHIIKVTQSGISAPVFYVDNVSVAVSLLGGDPNFAKPAAQGSAIGAFGALGTQNFNGALKYVGIFSKVLSTEERAEYYNGGNGKAWPFSPIALNLFTKQAVKRAAYV